MLIWPGSASVCSDNGAADLQSAAVVWLIPDCGLSQAFTSLITFCLLRPNPDQLTASRPVGIYNLSTVSTGGGGLLNANYL